MKHSNESAGEYSDDEAALRRDEVVKRMLATPPQPKPKRSGESKRGRPKKTAS